MNRIKCTGTNISSVLETVQFNLETRVEEERNARRWHSLHLQTCVCVCAPVNAWRWHSHNIHLTQECVLMSIFGGGAIISIFNCVGVLMSMLGGGTAIQQQSPS